MMRVLSEKKSGSLEHIIPQPQLTVDLGGPHRSKKKARGTPLGMTD
jgi:hypothetical protein